jgi:predicted nucleotidyltransferase
VADVSQRQNLAEDLDWLVGRIRDGYDPEKIILFGSLARGDAHEWSDIDLIVVKDTDASYGERVKMLMPLIRDRLVGADILIYSTEEYTRARKTGGAFLREAERDGKVLYERHR